MSAIPTPGVTSPWGFALNAYLQTQHLVDGTHTILDTKYGTGDAVIPDATNRYGLALNPVLTIPTNGNAWSFVVAGNFVKAASGTHPVVVNSELDFPHVVGGSAAIDTIVAVRIGADNLPPYAQATTVLGLQVLNGIARFQGGGANDVARPSIQLANNQLLTWLGASGTPSDGFFMNYNSSNLLKIGLNNQTFFTLTTGGGLLLSDVDPGFANAAGRLTQPNNATHFWADAAGGATNAMFIQGASDNTLRLGAGNTTRVTISSGGIFMVGTTVTSGALVGDVVIGNARNLDFVNAAGTSALSAVFMSGGNNILIGGNGVSVIAIGSPASLTSTVAGDLVLATGKALRWANNAGTDTLALLASNSSDQLVLLTTGADIKWNKPLVALGGGAAPTFGTIGGSGPATAAQNSWMRVIDSTGAAFWVPTWK